MNIVKGLIVNQLTFFTVAFLQYFNSFYSPSSKISHQTLQAQIVGSAE